eukprot:TRINITY_DN1847_c0_g1_i4.p1 TRINITY_DN1847_c0_g1~~TRINITY_DN1847_c0_g1_i4.p1  ORF type:complete len:706 (+),score=94.37 TRINITY_DN1847_c0_g1_i4:2-2119(+)
MCIRDRYQRRVHGDTYIFNYFVNSYLHSSKMNASEQKLSTLKIKLPSDFHPNEVIKNIQHQDCTLLDIEAFIYSTNFTGPQLNNQVLSFTTEQGVKLKKDITLVHKAFKQNDIINCGVTDLPDIGSNPQQKIGCNVHSHTKRPCHYICTNNNCHNSFNPICELCVKTSHAHHIDECTSLEELMDFLENNAKTLPKFSLPPKDSYAQSSKAAADLYKQIHSKLEEYERDIIGRVRSSIKLFKVIYKEIYSQAMKKSSEYKKLIGVDFEGQLKQLLEKKRKKQNSNPFQIKEIEKSLSQFAPLVRVVDKKVTGYQQADYFENFNKKISVENLQKTALGTIDLLDQYMKDCLATQEKQFLEIYDTLTLNFTGKEIRQELLNMTKTLGQFGDLQMNLQNSQRQKYQGPDIQIQQSEKNSVEQQLFSSAQHKKRQEYTEEAKESEENNLRGSRQVEIEQPHHVALNQMFETGSELDIYPLDILQKRKGNRQTTTLRYPFLHYYDIEALTYGTTLFTTFQPKMNFKLDGICLTGYHTVGGLLHLQGQQLKTFSDLQSNIQIQFTVVVTRGDSLQRGAEILHQEVVHLPLIANLNRRAFTLPLSKFETMLQADESYSIAIVYTEKNYHLNMLRGYKQEEVLQDDEHVEYIRTDKTLNSFVIESKDFGSGFKFLEGNDEFGHILYFVVRDVESEKEGLFIQETSNQFKGFQSK